MFLLLDIDEISAQLKEHSLLGGGNKTPLALQALVEVADINPKYASHLIETTHRNAVGARFVPVFLLIIDAG
jgi:hypothetical protein